MSLQDSLWQFFVEPNEFSFLNFNPNFSETTIQITDYKKEYSMVKLEMYIDQEIHVSERVIKDAVTLFGDIGGFSSFFIALLGLFVGSIPAQLFQISVTSALFRANLKKVPMKDKINTPGKEDE